MKETFDKVTIQCSRLITKTYSTSFSLGVHCLNHSLRNPVYSIYGFVRFADEIVDTFHDFDKKTLLQRFKEDTYQAIREKISLNPILNSFQATVTQYQIEEELIEKFLKSMEMDLSKTNYDAAEFKEYVLGSAEVVGLMCLKVFCYRDNAMYQHLKPYAMSLGSAFQKVNFLRDLKADYTEMKRIYFPGLQINTFNEDVKKSIEESIEKDFAAAYIGLRQLPRSARLGVYVAYVYYLALFKKIRNTPSELVLRGRIRIPNYDKAKLLAYSFIKHQLNLI